MFREPSQAVSKSGPREPKPGRGFLPNRAENQFQEKRDPRRKVSVPSGWMEKPAGFRGDRVWTPPRFRRSRRRSRCAATAPPVCSGLMALLKGCCELVVNAGHVRPHPLRFFPRPRWQRQLDSPPSLEQWSIFISRETRLGSSSFKRAYGIETLRFPGFPGGGGWGGRRRGLAAVLGAIAADEGAPLREY